jgi:hypothetical protein
MRAFVLVAVLVPSLASADNGPPISAGMEYSLGRGGHVGELELGTRYEPGFFVRFGRWQATLAMPIHWSVETSKPERDGKLGGFGIGPRLAYRAPFFGGVLTVGAGFARRWMYGEEEVMRTCTQTRECIAGTYVEMPVYHGWSAQGRIGIGADKVMPTMVMSISAELIVEPTAFNDVPPDGIRNVAVAGALTFAIGWGPRR